jgi:hypothetical protein
MVFRKLFQEAKWMGARTWPVVFADQVDLLHDLRMVRASGRRSILHVPQILKGPMRFFSHRPLQVHKLRTVLAGQPRLVPVAIN